MNAILVNSNATANEAITWCSFNFPNQDPTVEYSNVKLVLNFESANLQVAWTFPSILELSDVIGGLGCMFPRVPPGLVLDIDREEETIDKEDADGWLYLRGWHQWDSEFVPNNVVIANLYPTMGCLNRTRYPLVPPCWQSVWNPYSKEESVAGRVLGSGVWLAQLWFLLTLDYVPVAYCVGVYLYLAQDCDYISDSDTICSTHQWLLYSLGLLTTMFGLVVMPLVLTVQHRRYSKQFE